MTNLFFPFPQRHTPGSPPPHRDIQGSGPLVYFLCMNVVGISMFMLKPKGMYITNEFLYYENEHRAFENIECELDLFLSFYHAFIRVEEECHDVSNKSPKKPSRFGHNSVRMSILKVNLTPSKLNFLSLKYKIWIPGMSEHDVDKSVKLSKFHAATLNVGNSQVLQLQFS